MIRNKSELKEGCIILNQKPHFKCCTIVVSIKNGLVYSEFTVMPTEFYLNKKQFSLVTCADEYIETKERQHA